MNASFQQRVRRPQPAVAPAMACGQRRRRCPRPGRGRDWRGWLLGAWATVWCACLAQAGVSEPDNLVYGTIALGTTPVTAADTGVVVEARRTLPGAAIARYRMGDDAAANAGNFYALRLALETGSPTTSPIASATGDTLYLVVLDASGIRDSKTLTVGARGQITRIDFGNIDTDHNGLPDEWERSHFGGLGQDPNADADHDGLTNLQEYQRGTDPLAPDNPHPADSNPTDYAISITEVTAYGMAWKVGNTWPGGPNPIPIDYVTRAGTLWKGGELYKQDLTAAPGAPLWWVNATGGGKLMSVGTGAQSGPRALASTPAATATSTNDLKQPTATRTLPAFLAGSGPITVGLVIDPGEAGLAYAVEENPPPGWEVSDISDAGRRDTTSGAVRWGPFFDSQARSLSYVLTPPAGAFAEATFDGAASFDGTSLTIDGPATVSALPDEGAVTARFAGFQFSAANGFHAVLHGTPGQTYQIEVSTDLAHWVPLRTEVAGGDGHLEFTDTDVSGEARFYRAQAR